MKVSIAISTFEANGTGCNLLSNNLDKIAMQTYPNIEVVISDHSKDNNISNLLNSYSNKLNIVYIKNPNNYGNTSNNINNAINHCSGDLIKIIFMDDYLFLPNSIQLIVDEFNKYSNRKWLVNSYAHTQNYKKIFWQYHPKNNPKMGLGINTIGCPSGLTIRKVITQRFDENLKWFMDCDYYYRLYLNYGEPIYLHKILVINYLHANQVTNKQINDDLVKREYQYIVQKYKKKN